MRDVAGLVFALAALGFVLAGLKRRRQALRMAEAGVEAAPRHPSLALLGEVGPYIVNLMLIVAALQVTLAFVVSDGGGIFSWLDLAGFLALLAGYGYWVSMKSRHRV